MLGWEALPDAPLAATGPVSAAFLSKGAQSCRAAGRLVYQLPYGRTSSRADFMSVLAERRGTCSSKHALLGALALEQHLPIALMLGIYLMNERNTPGVGPVLARHALAEIPEAHCYLMHRGTRIDVTREIAAAAEPIGALLHEEQIAPAQAGAYKVRFHQEFLRRWLPTAQLSKSLTFDELWRIREQCIAALSK